MDRKPVQVGEVKQLDQPHRVFGKEIVAGCCKLSPVQHEAVELLGRAADRRQAEAAAARGELLVEMGEEQPGQIADLLCDEEIVPHETLDARRSEEHTSELQSLMRTSYAVFCLKKKKKEVNDITRTKRARRMRTQRR